MHEVGIPAHMVLHPCHLSLASLPLVAAMVVYTLTLISRYMPSPVE
jgi:hypothetical protein